MPSGVPLAATRRARPTASLRAAAARISCTAGAVMLNVIATPSMFALGAQQAGQAVALLLRAAHRKQVVQVMVVAAVRPPGLGEVPDHHAHLRLHPMLLVVA